MGEQKDTGIPWTHYTFNTHIGCFKISEGCESCYAWADMDLRRHRVTWGPLGTRSTTSEAYWRQPFAWNRAAYEAGERRRVFCCSLADIFEVWDGGFIDSHKRPVWEVDGQWIGTDSPEVPGERLTIHHVRARLWKTILATPWLDWLLLTKRPANILPALQATWEYMKARGLSNRCLTAWIDGTHPPGNVWMGTSVENQRWANERIPLLLGVPAVVRFLSVEPMLEQINFRTGIYTSLLTKGPEGTSLDGIHLAIYGGESDQAHKKGRTLDADWIRFGVAQCRSAGVAAFVKQMGSNAHDRGTPLKRVDTHGADMAYWPADLRGIREMPAIAHQPA